MPISCFNGDNETHITASRSVSLSYFKENNIELSIKTDKPIEFWISRLSSMISTKFKPVNVTNMTFTNENNFINYGFNYNLTNSSIHIEIKPDLKNISYIFMLKFGDIPRLNNTDASYDLLKIFCPFGN